MKFHILAVTVACAQMTMAQVQDDGLAQRINNLKRGNTNRGLKGHRGLKGQNSQRELFDPENPDARELMPLQENGCAKAENICDWTGPREAKYSVCYRKTDGTFETKCVDYDSASKALGSLTKSSKRTLTACGCCASDSKCPRGPFPEPICPDDPKCPTGSGKGKGGNGKKTFCFFDKSMNADSVQQCEDPYNTIKESEGDIFLACGTACSAMPSSSPSATPSSQPSSSPSATPSSQPSSSPSATPSSQPSQAPSSTPTDSCLACDGNAEFVFMPAFVNWDNHKKLAEQMGCVMASINSPAEQLAAQKVASDGRDLLPPGFLNEASRLVWLGAERTASTPRATFSWIDGSGTFTGADKNITTTTYANWQAGENVPVGADIDSQPDGGDAVFMAYPDYDGAPLSRADWDDWTWGDLSKIFPLPALYLCCDGRSIPRTRFAGCAVSP